MVSEDGAQGADDRAFTNRYELPEWFAHGSPLTDPTLIIDIPQDRTISVEFELAGAGARTWMFIATGMPFFYRPPQLALPWGDSAYIHVCHSLESWPYPTWCMGPVPNGYTPSSEGPRRRADRHGTRLIYEGEPTEQMHQFAAAFAGVPYRYPREDQPVTTIREFIEQRVNEDQARAEAAIESLRRDATDPNIIYHGDLGHWESEHGGDNGTGIYTHLVTVTEQGDGGATWDGVQMVIYSGDGKPTREVADHMAGEDPAATLRRCVMVRAIMRHAEKARQLDEEIEQDSKSTGAATSPAEPWIDEQMHRDIAAYWNTHADYREEWTPNA